MTDTLDHDIVLAEAAWLDRAPEDDEQGRASAMDIVTVGRDLDAEIARRVFGFWLATHPNDPERGESWWGPHGSIAGAWAHASACLPVRLRGPSYRSSDGLPLFSTDLSAAWAVVEHFRARGWLVTVKDMPDGFPYILGEHHENMKLRRRSVCDMQWMPQSTPEDCRRFIYRHPHGAGDTPAEAICRAGLDAAAAERAGDVSRAEIDAAWAPRGAER